MPAHSTAFKNAVLDGILGTTRGSGAPDSYYVELWIDRPDADGAQEADFGGYASVEWDSDDWDAAEGGAKDASSAVDFGLPSSAGSDAIRYWALRDVDTNELAYSGPLSSPVNVTASEENNLRILPTVPYGA